MDSGPTQGFSRTEQQPAFCCPDLCSIHFSASYCFATNDFDTLEDFEYAALIHSSKALGNFAAEVAGLGRLMTDSLISHFDSLVSVDLCIRRRYQYTHDGGGGGVISRSIDIANTARILSSCSRLRIFRLSSAENVIEMRAALELFSLPWACLGLEILSLSQILLPNLNSKQERGGRSTATAPAAMSSLRAFGWHPQSKSGPLAACTQSSTTTSREALVTAGIPSPPNFALTTTPNSAAMAATLPTPSPLEADDDLWRFGTEFKCKLLPQVSSLKVLKELCLNKVIYARTAVA